MRGPAEDEQRAPSWSIMSTFMQEKRIAVDSESMQGASPRRLFTGERLLYGAGGKPLRVTVHGGAEGEKEGDAAPFNWEHVMGEPLDDFALKFSEFQNWVMTPICVRGRDDTDYYAPLAQVSDDGVEHLDFIQDPEKKHCTGNDYDEGNEWHHIMVGGKRVLDEALDVPLDTILAWNDAAQR